LYNYRKKYDKVGLFKKKQAFGKNKLMQSHVKCCLNIRSNLLTSLIIYKGKALMHETDPFITLCNTIGY